METEEIRAKVGVSRIFISSCNDLRIVKIERLIRTYQSYAGVAVNSNAIAWFMSFFGFKIDGNSTEKQNIKNIAGYLYPERSSPEKKSTSQN